MGKPRSTYRTDIQGLRAVAVLLVVLGHAGVTQFSGGYVGVDVFFVLSGFLITGLLISEAKRRRGISLANFYARRARRILPAATVVLLATLMAAYVLLGRVRTGEIARETIFAAFFAVNWTFSLDGTDYFASTLPPSPIQHYWSLAVEEQFYLIWPALVLAVLFGGSRKRKSKPGTYKHRPSALRWKRLAVVMSVLAVASLTYSVVFTAQAPAAAYFSSFTRVWELAVGALLALSAAQLARVPAAVQAPLGWLGMAGIAGSAMLFTETTAFPGVAALLPVASTAVVIAAGIDGPSNGPVALLGTAPLRWLGDRSYSLYLWHWPVLVIAAAYLGYELSLFQNAVLMVLALGLTMATYTYIEHPIHTGRVVADRLGSLLMWPASFAILSIVVLISLDAVRIVPGFAAAGPGFVQFAGSAADTTAEPADEDAKTILPASDDPIAGAVAAAVTAAEEAIPGALFPSLDQVRQDTYQRDVGPSCTTKIGDSTSKVCHLGPDDAEQSMVIFGDSYAGMWIPALADIADEIGWKLYYFVKTSCPSADVAQPQRQQTECPEWRDWAMAEIAELEPDITILSNHRSNQPLADANGNAISYRSDQHPGVWEAGLAASIETLQLSSERVVVFSTSALSDDDPVSCLDRPDATLGECTVRISENVEQTNAANKRAVATTGAEFLDLSPWFCADGRCPMVINQMVVYYSPGHITRTYGLAIADSLRAALSPT